MASSVIESRNPRTPLPHRADPRRKATLTAAADPLPGDLREALTKITSHVEH